MSPDGDYGAVFDNRSFINDHLRQEVSERVSRKREVSPFSKLSEALKLFSMAITAQEEEEERFIVEIPNSEPSAEARPKLSLVELARLLQDRTARQLPDPALED